MDFRDRDKARAVARAWRFGGHRTLEELIEEALLEARQEERVRALLRDVERLEGVSP
jgi:hypothetical protein